MASSAEMEGVVMRPVSQHRVGRRRSTTTDHISNVAIVDPKDHKPTRVGITREGGSRKRVTRRSGTELD